LKKRKKRRKKKRKKEQEKEKEFPQLLIVLFLFSSRFSFLFFCLSVEIFKEDIQLVMITDEEKK